MAWAKVTKNIPPISILYFQRAQAVLQFGEKVSDHFWMEKRFLNGSWASSVKKVLAFTPSLHLLYTVENTQSDDL